MLMTRPPPSKHASPHPPQTTRQWLLAFEPLLYAQHLNTSADMLAMVEGACGKFAKSKQANKGSSQNKNSHTTLTTHLTPILSQGREVLATDFKKTNDGAAYLGGHTLLLDRLLACIYSNAIHAHPSASQTNLANLAVIATGGYGRGELCPYSDIDLLFLTADSTPAEATTPIIEYMLYVLWDLGLRVGHASRSVSSAIQSAQSDITIRTTLLDARHLVGEAKLTATLKKRFAEEVMADTALSFIDAKIKERDARHRRSHAHRYMLEPNIKEGKGGLRDLHTLFWIARYAYHTGSVADMIRLGVLTMGEARGFSAAQRFLWALRCHMHLRSGREDDRLSFDAQQALAPYFADDDSQADAAASNKQVEQFMRRYFLAATLVGNLTRIFCSAIADKFSDSASPISPATPLPKPFVLQSGRIALAAGADFQKTPKAILAIFALALKTGLDIHPYTLRALIRARPLIDETFCADPKHNAAFLAILTDKRSCERVLRLMNEVGVLGRFIPDFGKIVARMQFSTYHSYTVDEHTIHAIGILHDIEKGALRDIAPLASRAVHEIDGRQALYVALLLHDIAKGQGGDHSVLGEGVARRLAPRFGLGEAESETVAWLVRQHLLMSDTAFRYDLSDPAVIERFAEAVQSPERLNLLLVLTVADIRAVGQNVWNGWKAALMRDLYTRSMAVLLGADAATLVARQATTMADDLAYDLTRGKHASKSKWDEASMRAHIDGFPASYWSLFDRDGYARYAELFMKFAKTYGGLQTPQKKSSQSKNESPAMFCLTPDAARRATELAVITADDVGLFSRICGGIVAAGANIVDARITTRKDGLTLDVLWLQDQDKSAITDNNRLRHIEESVRSAMAGKLNIRAAIDRRWRQTPTRIRQRPEQARVLVNNRISRTHSVLEINSKDAPGLLYRVSGAMADMGLQIQMASVSTYGDRVVDVFYIKDGFGLKIDQPARLKQIQRRLLQVLEDSDPANKIVANL